MTLIFELELHIRT